MTVRIEGMGWLGSLLAHKLDREGIAFTWYDNDGPSAWRASTGCVYPVASAEREYESYSAWAHSSWPEVHCLANYIEHGTFTFNHKNAPHGSALRVFPAMESSNALRKVLASSIHVNVRGFVEMTRALFMDRQERNPIVPLTTDVRVVAHGFRRAEAFVWGWSCPVRLALAPELETPDRLCLYLKPHRFELAYAFPIPGDPERWWAGSSMIRQERIQAKPAEYVTDLVQKWVGTVELLSGGAVEAWPEYEGIRQGWRPKAAGPLDATETFPEDRSVVAPALGPNGVRFAPQALESLYGAVRSLL